MLTDFLFVPVALSLYLALKGINRDAMLLATALVGLFVALDLAITWSHYASLLTLSTNYDAATNDVQRAAYVAAAHSVSAMLTSRLEVVYAIVILSMGILMISYVMLKGVFSRTTAYLGLLTGILGIVSITGLSVTIIMNAIFATLLGLVCRLQTLPSRSRMMPSRCWRASPSNAVQRSPQLR